MDKIGLETPRRGCRRRSLKRTDRENTAEIARIEADSPIRKRAFQPGSSDWARRDSDGALVGGPDRGTGVQDRPAGHHPALLHAGRHRRRRRLQPRGVHRDRRARPRRLADRRGAGRGIGARLEGVRDGGGARSRRTTASSSARSRTSTRWACIPATRSRWRRR